jgi:GTPase SAR1 family protein
MSENEVKSILLLGASGVGKSSLIQTISNYLLDCTFDRISVVIPHCGPNLDQISEDGRNSICLTPSGRSSSSSLSSTTTLDQIVSGLESLPPSTSGESVTRSCTTYEFSYVLNDVVLENGEVESQPQAPQGVDDEYIRKIRFIDTPGLCDSRSKQHLDQDFINLELISDAISTAQNLSAVIIVLNGSQARVTQDLIKAFQLFAASLPDRLFSEIIVVISNCPDSLACNVTKTQLQRLLSPFVHIAHVLHFDNGIWLNRTSTLKNKKRFKIAFEQTKTLLTKLLQFDQDLSNVMNEMKCIEMKCDSLSNEILTNFKQSCQALDQLYSQPTPISETDLDLVLDSLDLGPILSPVSNEIKTICRNFDLHKQFQPLCQQLRQIVDQSNKNTIEHAQQCVLEFEKQLDFENAQIPVKSAIKLHFFHPDIIEQLQEEELREIESNRKQSKLNKTKLVLNEILSSERSYCDSLKEIVDILLPKAKKFLTITECNHIFGNIVDVYNASKAVVDHLEQFINDEFNPNTTIISENINAILPIIQPIITYSSTYSKADETIKSLKPRQVKRLTNLLAPRHVASSLVLPVQRAARYQLLMKSMLDFTPTDHPDYHFRTHTLQLLESFAFEVNRAIGNFENLSAVAKEYRLPADIVVANRQFKKTQVFTRVTPFYNSSTNVQYQIFLFNDLIGFIEVGSTSKLFNFALPINGSFEVHQLQDDQRSFIFTSPKSDLSLKLIAPDESIVTEWVTLINQQIDSNFKDGVFSTINGLCYSNSLKANAKTIITTNTQPRCSICDDTFGLLSQEVTCKFCLNIVCSRCTIRVVDPITNTH